MKRRTDAHTEGLEEYLRFARSKDMKITHVIDTHIQHILRVNRGQESAT